MTGTRVPSGAGLVPPSRRPWPRCSGNAKRGRAPASTWAPAPTSEPCPSSTRTLGRPARRWSSTYLRVSRLRVLRDPPVVVAVDRLALRGSRVQRDLRGPLVLRGRAALRAPLDLAVLLVLRDLPARRVLLGLLGSVPNRAPDQRDLRGPRGARVAPGALAPRDLRVRRGRGRTAALQTTEASRTASTPSHPTPTSSTTPRRMLRVTGLAVTARTSSPRQTRRSPTPRWRRRW